MLGTSCVVVILLVVCPFFSKANDQTEDFYKRLVGIVNSSPSPKGTPFPDFIPSPKCLNDRIGIVGAGPAGIHMAYLLKKKGFNNVVVLEGSERIGGKSLSVKYRDVVHEMGTCYSQPDYKDNIVALAKEFVLWDPVDIPSGNIWLDENNNPILYKTYVIKEIMTMLHITDQAMATKALFSAILRYAKLHRKLFGKYEGEIMWKPAPATMNILRCTFYEFLQKYNLTALKPIFIASHTIQGYGHLDEISALYGLMWNTPNFLKGLTEKFLGIRGHGLNMIRGGFQNLWEVVKRWQNIRVIFNVKIRTVKRKKTFVYVQDQRGVWRQYDFLIWTPSLFSNSRVVDACRKEARIFSKLRPVWFTTTLFDSTYGKRGDSPIDYWISNIENKVDHAVWAQRDSYGTLEDLIGSEYQNGSLPGGPDGKFIRTGVLYQYGKTKPTIDELTQKAFRQLNDTGASNIRFLQGGWHIWW